MSTIITQKDLDLALKKSQDEGLGKINELQVKRDRRSDNIGESESYYNRSTKTYDLTKLSDLHYQIIRYLALGKKNAEIAELLAISPHTVSRIRNNEMTNLALKAIRFEMNKKAAGVAKRIADLSYDAVEVMEKVIRGEGEFQNIELKERVSASKDILSRAGHGYVKKITKVNTNLTDDILKNIKHQVLQNRSSMVSERAKAMSEEIQDAEIVEGD